MPLPFSAAKEWLEVVDKAFRFLGYHRFYPPVLKKSQVNDTLPGTKQRLNKKMKKKEHLIVGIDIGSHAVKVCQLMKNSNNYKLIAAGSAILSPGTVEDGVLQNPDEVGKTIDGLLKNLKIKNKKIGISISGYSVIVKKITLDNMKEESLAEYINNEAEQYIPFDINDVYLDFIKLPKKNILNEKIEIMLVAAKKEIVNDYIKLLEDINLQPVLVDVDGFALENIWESNSGKIENVVLVDIGASKMNINIISEGISVLARDIVVGSEQLTVQIANILEIEYTQAEKIKHGIEIPEGYIDIISAIYRQTCTQWVLEIKKAIDLYVANYPDNPLHLLVLSGGGSKVSGLSSYIEQETKLTVCAFNPFKKMVIDKDKFDIGYLDLIAPEMAIATGLAIRQSPF